MITTFLCRIYLFTKSLISNEIFVRMLAVNGDQNNSYEIIVPKSYPIQTYLKNQMRDIENKLYENVSTKDLISRIEELSSRKRQVYNGPGLSNLSQQ